MWCGWIPAGLTIVLLVTLQHLWLEELREALMRICSPKSRSSDDRHAMTHQISVCVPMWRIP